MKDSILKGTGNSRFLKSAIPDGTTWTEALAMLRAGTFPMDLNGINSAGFQQVGTPLNKANLLKDVNALTLGLTGDAVPDDMFNVLAHAGDLHVWKKTTNGVVTYPVSTNRNAYQEGDDAKPAGYTLGDVVTGSFILADRNADQAYGFEYGDSLAVSDDGVVSMSNSANLAIGFGTYSYTANDIQNNFRGKFLIRSGGNTNLYSGYLGNDMVYIPDDTVVNLSSGVYSIDRYQPVTGYAAIPANTTIEYLGCLGEKTRMQVVSYVGTGTYGASNPCSLTLDFPPKVVMFLRGYKNGDTQYCSLYASYGSDTRVIITADLSDSFTLYNGFGRSNYAYAKKNVSGKIISWYNLDSAASQANNSGYTYYYLAIG